MGWRAESHPYVNSGHPLFLMQMTRKEVGVNQKVNLKGALVLEDLKIESKWRLKNGADCLVIPFR